jgi:hypothetical protein
VPALKTGKIAANHGRRAGRAKMKFWKALCGLGFLLVLASNVWSISGWTEIRGVYDDVCYLRQAHLFQRFGIDGLNTDISRDNDQYFAEKLKAIGFPTWRDDKTYPCHTPMLEANKLVLQYPPGTGFALALFPAEFQVIPLYVLASVVAFAFALAALSYASSLFSLALVAAFGDAAIYLMINPAKASYSMAPTMMVCGLAGFLTARLFASTAQRERLLLAMLIGLLFGVAVNFRLPNLFLSSGYFLFFFACFVLSRSREVVLQGLLFGAAFLVGMAPTLLANAINAGSALSTTYGDVDVKSPELSSGVIWSYLADMQFVLLVLAGAWTVLMLRLNPESGARRVAVVTAANLMVNVAFFMSHPVFTPYYTIPISMLSLWSLLFASLKQPAQAPEYGAIAQAARA